MRTYLPIVLGMLLLAGSAFADGPASAERDGMDKESGCFLDGSCCPRCRPCVPEWTTKKNEKVTYGCKCVEFCLPKCSWTHHACRDGGCCKESNGNACPTKCGECGGAGCLKCGHVRTKKVLIKKVHVTETCKLECMPGAGK